MSSSNTTLYYTAVESSTFKDVAVDTSAEEQRLYVANTDSQNATPKRQVRIRKYNIFATHSQEFSICRRQPMPATDVDLSPSSRDLRKEMQSHEMLRLRREHWQGEQRKPERRFAMRI